jgi:hypothetical protein
MSWSAILSAIAGLVGLIRDFFSWKKSTDDRKAGADDVAAKVNKDTSDAQDRMARVDDNPSDDAVAGRMRSGTF